jgi:hypothetical protein
MEYELVVDDTDVDVDEKLTNMSNYQIYMTKDEMIENEKTINFYINCMIVLSIVITGLIMFC